MLNWEKIFPLCSDLHICLTSKSVVGSVPATDPFRVAQGKASGLNLNQNQAWGFGAVNPCDTGTAEK